MAKATLLINKECRDRLGLSNNEYIFLLEVWNVQHYNESGWLEALNPRMTHSAFWRFLASLIDKTFTARGAEKLAKRLIDYKFLEVSSDGMKLRVLEAFHKENVRDTKAIQEGQFKKAEMRKAEGKTTTFATEKQAKTETAEEQALSNEEILDDVVNYAKMIKATDETKSLDYYRDLLMIFFNRGFLAKRRGLLNKAQLTWLHDLYAERQAEGVEKLYKEVINKNKNKPPT